MCIFAERLRTSADLRLVTRRVSFPSRHVPHAQLLCHSSLSGVWSPPSSEARWRWHAGGLHGRAPSEQQCSFGICEEGFWPAPRPRSRCVTEGRHKQRFHMPGGCCVVCTALRTVYQTSTPLCTMCILYQCYAQCAPGSRKVQFCGLCPCHRWSDERKKRAEPLPCSALQML